MGLYMENILGLEYAGTSTKHFLLVYHVKNKMRKNIQIKSKKIDQYVASFVKNFIQQTAYFTAICEDNLVFNMFYAQIHCFCLIKVLLGEIS